MSWEEDAAAAAADIHAEFADAILTIEPAASAAIVGVPAIEVDYPGDDPFGDGGSVRQHGFEIRKSAVPAVPRNGTIISRGSDRYRIVEVRNSRAVGAWLMMVEEA